MTRMRFFLPLAWALTVAGPAAALSGRVADPAGNPISGARACIVADGAEGVCAETDAAGWYRLPDTKLPKVRISMAGYLPRIVAAVDQEIVMMQPSAALRARLLDADSGEPIARGELTLASPSGRKTGPFPVNAAGLKVATVAPGRFVPTGRAPGYRDQIGDEVELLPGRETEIVLRLRKEPTPTPGS